MRSKLVEGKMVKHYYRLIVEEIEAEKCEVRLYSKVQCEADKWTWTWVILPASTYFAVGLLVRDSKKGLIGTAVSIAIMAPPTMLQRNSADKKATLRWSPKDDEDLDRIISFIRTDLIQND